MRDWPKFNELVTCLLEIVEASSKSLNMIQKEQAYRTTLKRIERFQRQIEELRKREANPENYRLSVSGFGSAHGFCWSTGGGVDLAVSRHIAIRPQFDYIGLRFSNGNIHSARASVSIVFRFGGR